MSSKILQSCKNNVKTIKINSPERKNAMTSEMYQEIANILNNDAVDDNIVITIITGIGEYFSSGNDLKSAMSGSGTIEEKLESFKKMVESFIKYPKVIIAVVNGPAIGIGATLPALCDIIYASNKASFAAPFVRMGLTLEGASSFTFPFNLGRSKASEVIYLNQKLSAEEAHQFGFISDVIPHSQLGQFMEKLHRHGNLPVKGIINNKKLVMDNFKNVLSQSNDREAEELINSISSPEFVEYTMSFIAKKSKL